jgi:hypothetical protein
MQIWKSVGNLFLGVLAKHNRMHFALETVPRIVSPKSMVSGLIRIHRLKKQQINEAEGA